MLRWVFGLVFVLCPATSLGADYLNEWQNLHEALLMESLDGDLDAAIMVYEGLAGRLPATPQTGPILAEALYQLGSGYEKHDDLDRAKLKLRECIRVSGSSQCRHALSVIVLQENAVPTLPIQWDFSSNEHGFVLMPGYGAMTVTKENEVPTLRWDLPSGSIPDFLAIAIKDEARKLGKILFRAKAVKNNYLLHIVAVDGNGHRYTLKQGRPLNLRQTYSEIELETKDFVLLENTEIQLGANLIDRIEFHVRQPASGNPQITGAILLQWFEAR
jgi:hypothetical protein